MQNKKASNNSKNKFNICVINLKGGSGKSTNASLIASFYNNSTLIEIDKINKSDLRIKTPYYNSMQIDFSNEQSNEYLEFENLLFEDGVKIIDVGAVKLEIFHKAMITNKLYEEIDLFIIPAMDGLDDFIVADKFLANIYKEINTSKVLFSFNRYNNKEYSIKEQFSSFFDNEDLLIDDYNIDLNSSYYVIPDRKSIKYARSQGISVRELIDTDDNELKELQRNAKNKEERLHYSKLRNVVINAKNLYSDYLVNMISMISKKMEN